jgi:tetratricopeptide (TPR) repeat protein
MAMMIPLLVTLVFASASPDALFQEGQALYADLEYEKALKKFTAAAEGASEGPKAAQIFLWKGLCESGLGKVDASRASFTAALNNNYDISLPGHASPKVKEVFDQVRTEIGQKLENDRNAAAVANADPVELPSANSDTGSGDGVQHTEGGGPTAMGVLGVGLLSVGAAGLITGGIFNGLAMQSLAQAEDPLSYQNEALEGQNLANTQMLIAAIAYGAGGVLVVAGGSMAIFGWSGE